MGQEKIAWSVREFAGVSGLSRAYIYVLIKKGELPTVKLGKRRLVLVEEGRRFLLAGGKNREQ